MTTQIKTFICQQELLVAHILNQLCVFVLSLAESIASIQTNIYTRTMHVVEFCPHDFPVTFPESHSVPTGIGLRFQTSFKEFKSAAAGAAAWAPTISDIQLGLRGSLDKRGTKWGGQPHFVGPRGPSRRNKRKKLKQLIIRITPFFEIKELR